MIQNSLISNSGSFLSTSLMLKHVCIMYCEKRTNTIWLQLTCYSIGQGIAQDPRPGTVSISPSHLIPLISSLVETASQLNRVCLIRETYRMCGGGGGGGGGSSTAVPAEAHFRPTSYKLSIYLYVNSALRSFSRKLSSLLYEWMNEQTI